MSEQSPIDRGFFRETDDGATVFFPWGLSHRGYRLPSAEAKKKASRAASLLIGSVIAIGVGTGHALTPVIDSDLAGPGEILQLLALPVAALTLVLVAYGVWASRFVERCPTSDLQISRRDRLREASEFTAPWKIALIGVVTVGLSILVIWLDPRTWWLGLLGIAVGIGLLLFGAALWRAADDATL